METIVFILLLLVCFNFMLKQTYQKPLSIFLTAVVCAVFTGLMWRYAIEQSKTQIADWLADPALMLDIAVVLSVEVILQMSFCMLAAHILTSDRVLRKRALWTYRFLRWFPGLLIFPVLFATLVYAIFLFPGVSFSQTAWLLGGSILLLIPAGTFLLRYILPEKELRLELLFLTNALVAVLGVIATVNGQTAVQGISEVDWGALAGIVLLTVFGASAGMLWRKMKQNKQKQSR